MKYYGNNQLIVFIFQIFGLDAVVFIVWYLGSPKVLWNTLYSDILNKTSVTLSFPSVLKNETYWILKSEIYHPFPDSKKKLLIYFKIDDTSIFDVHNPIGIKLLNRLRLNFSHLNEHKFRHNFRCTVNLSYLCNAETETTSHYLLSFVFRTKNETPWKPQ